MPTFFDEKLAICLNSSFPVGPILCPMIVSVNFPLHSKHPRTKTKYQNVETNEVLEFIVSPGYAYCSLFKPRRDGDLAKLFNADKKCRMNIQILSNFTK